MRLLNLSFLSITRLRTTSVLAFLTTIMIVTGCHGNQASTEKNGLIPVHLQADWYPRPEQGGYYTAVVKGYYQAEGLDVTILPLGQYTSCPQIVASGGAEFG